MDAIDEEMATFDNLEKDKESDSVAQSGGVGSRVVGSALFLKNLFTQIEPSKQLPPKSKFTRMARKPILSSEFRGRV